MTEAPRRARWSKGKVRAVAWLSAGLAFLVSGAAIAVAPKPPTNEVAHRRPRPAPRKTIIQHRVIRSVIVDPPVSTGGNATVYTTSASGSSGSSGGTTTTSTTSSSSGSSGSSGGTPSGGGTSATTTTTGGS